MTIHVLYGPQASGKTRNAKAIAARLGCSQIFDDFNISDRRAVEGLPDGALVITNAWQSEIEDAMPMAKLYAIEAMLPG